MQTLNRAQRRQLERTAGREPIPHVETGRPLAQGPTVTPWLNSMLPRVVPSNWAVVETPGDRRGVTYQHAFGLTVRVSGAVRHDGNRWVYLHTWHIGRALSLEDFDEVKRLILGPDVLAVALVPAAGATLPPGTVLITACLDKRIFPPGVGPDAEYR
jgi:hypothetical protein